MDKDTWNTVVTAGSTLFGALLGAAVGGVISWSIQRQIIAEARGERMKSKRQTEIATAYTIYAKLLKIRYTFEELSRYRKRVAKSPNYNPEQPWLSAVPFANIPAPVYIDKDEIAFLFRTNKSNLMLRPTELADKHNDLLSILLKYVEQRESCFANLPDDVASGHIRTSLQVFPHKMHKISVPMNSLINQIFKRTETQTPIVIEIYDDFYQYCRSTYPEFPDITPDTE